MQFQLRSTEQNKIDFQQLIVGTNNITSSNKINQSRLKIENLEINQLYVIVEFLENSFMNENNKGKFFYMIFFLKK